MPFISQEFFPYSADQLLLTAVFLAGAIAGITRKLPLWSYSWTVLAIDSASGLIGAVSTAIFVSQGDPTIAQISAVFSLIRLGGTLLIIAFAVSRVNLGLRYTFFVVILALSEGPVTASLLDSLGFASLTSIVVINAYLITLTLLAVVVLMTMVMRFVVGDEHMQRNSVYVLIAMVLTVPLFTDWTIYGVIPLESPGPIVQFVAITSASRLGYLVVSLLIAWGLAVGFRNLTRKPASKSDLAGENHAG